MQGHSFSNKPDQIMARNPQDVAHYTQIFTYQFLLTLLKKPFEVRNEYENHQIAILLPSSGYFRQFRNKHGEPAYEYICQYLLARQYSKGDVVFDKGDIGNEFYIILKGSVGVYVPIKSIEGEQDILKEVRVLEIGESFGELALLKKNGQRAATIICRENTELAYFTKLIFDKLLLDKESNALTDHLNFLNHLRLFNGYTEAFIKEIFLFLKIKFYQRYQFVYRETNAIDNFYIIRHGTFVCKKLGTTQDIQVQQFIKNLNFIVQICTLSSGEVFGFEDFIENSEGRTLSVQCTTADGELYVLNKNDFKKRLLTVGQISKNLERMAGKNKQILSDRLSQHISLTQRNKQDEVKRQTENKPRFKSLIKLDPIETKTLITEQQETLGSQYNQSPLLMKHKSEASFRTENLSTIQRKVLSPLVLKKTNKKVEGHDSKKSAKLKSLEDFKNFYGLRSKLQQFQQVKEIWVKQEIYIPSKDTVYQEFFESEVSRLRNKIKQQRQRKQYQY